LAASGELAFALQDGFSGFVSVAGFSSWDTCRKCEKQFSFLAVATDQPKFHCFT